MNRKRKKYQLASLRLLVVPSGRNYTAVFPSQDEKFDPDKGPSVEQLVIQESVDKLDYMGWQVDQGADPEKVGLNCD